ncbi:MAG TPA: complex I subunit 1 family protein [Planctomycetota bacterium]|nr:complex I subunit 1 family protein [Planctomycetota bacterium]
MPFIYYYLIGQGIAAQDLNALQQFFSVHPTLAGLVAVAIPCLIAFGVVQAVSGGSTYIERKVAADIQRRIGPNKCNVGAFLGEWARQVVANGKNERAGAGGKAMAAIFGLLVPLFDAADKIVGKIAPGVLIFLADGIKLIMKEDIIPDPVDKPLFKLAPTVVLASAFGAVIALPYSDAFYIADPNIGIFYIAAITSMEVLGILMAGWASNNKWALLGGMRSAAQIVSYELPVGLAIATGILISGTMSMQAMTFDQLGITEKSSYISDGWFWQWNFFHPAMFILAPVYFLAALAECNRTPFDIPEAESELVSGYHTEYSGMRFAIFFMAEYAMMCVTSGIAVALFLGGWSTGIAPLERALVTGFNADGTPQFHIVGTLIHLLAFGVKTYGLVLIMMWIRWTLPRFRVDQMMTLCWKKLIPLGMLCFFGVAVWMIARMYLVARIGEGAMTGITFALRALFAFGFIGWLIWFFAKPLTKEQQEQRELLAKAHLNTGTAL